MATRTGNEEMAWSASGGESWPQLPSAGFTVVRTQRIAAIFHPGLETVAEPRL
jgi:hypothetical protein